MQQDERWVPMGSAGPTEIVAVDVGDRELVAWWPGARPRGSDRGARRART